MACLSSILGTLTQIARWQHDHELAEFGDLKGCQAFLLFMIQFIEETGSHYVAEMNVRLMRFENWMYEAKGKKKHNSTSVELGPSILAIYHIPYT